MELLLVLIVLSVVLLAGSLVVIGVRRRRPGALPGEPPAERRPTAPPRPVVEAEAEPVATAPPAVEAPAAPAPVVEPEAPVIEPEPVVVEAPAEPEPLVVPEPPVVEPPEKPRWRDRLSKARGLLGQYFGSVLSRTAIDDDTWDELEEALIRADVGVERTTTLLDGLRARVKDDGIRTPTELLEALKAGLKKDLVAADRSLRYEPGAPNVWLFVGVNGVGKTTTIGKVALEQASMGRTVVLAAGDTFRAAAAEQLTIWGDRVGAEVVRGSEGGDPGSVVFDAVQRAGSRGIGLVLADTAGRLHTKTNLMEELRKVRRVAEREPGKVTEVLLVIDATTGQNGLVQAAQFTEAVEVTGIVLTKLDGTAKGGIALTIQTELGIPIKLVGLGEGAGDLIAFDPDEFVEALFT